MAVSKLPTGEMFPTLSDTGQATWGRSLMAGGGRQGMPRQQE